MELDTKKSLKYKEAQNIFLAGEEFLIKFSDFVFPNSRKKSITMSDSKMNESGKNKKEFLV